MSKIDQYRRGLEICLDNAAKAPTDELRAIWQTIGKSYVFLAELESGPGGTASFATGDGRNTALAGRPFTERSTDDRIRS